MSDTEGNFDQGKKAYFFKLMTIIGFSFRQMDSSRLILACKIIKKLSMYTYYIR